MNKLTHQKCVPCEGGTKPLTREEFDVYIDQVKDWNVTTSDKKLEREFVFKNFKEALNFVNQIGAIAEQEGHHPDINLYNYKKVKITLSTHAIGGLSVNDFILAVKIDELEQ